MSEMNTEPALSIVVFLFSSVLAKRGKSRRLRLVSEGLSQHNWVKVGVSEAKMTRGLKQELLNTTSYVVTALVQ